MGLWERLAHDGIISGLCSQRYEHEFLNQSVVSYHYTIFVTYNFVIRERSSSSKLVLKSFIVSISLKAGSHRDDIGRVHVRVSVLLAVSQAFV